MKIVILGAGGRLGAALLREYRDRFEVTGFDRTQLDLSDLNDLREKLQETGFDVLINAAGFTKVDVCETQPERAFLINAEAPRVLAEICAEKSARLIHFSTDYVFDGEKREPYSEEDEATPISVYGESKLAGEKNVLAAQDRNLVVRVSWVFGPDRPSFVDAMVKGAQESERIDAVADKFSNAYLHVGYRRDAWGHFGWLEPARPRAGRRDASPRDPAFRKCWTLQLAGICAMGSGLLPATPACLSE
jgi:dTDP-4-dehydrorhamnose reductase